MPTASRAGDLQVGGGFSLADGDYDHSNWKGVTGYASFDFRSHLGVEFDIHQVNAPSPSGYYERTYELGGRYVRHYGRWNPYGRLMYGRGVFNYQEYNKVPALANLAYNLLAGGVGVDVNVTPHVNVRGDFEYQQWYSFKGVQTRTGIASTASTLSPSVFTIGAAYHFQ